MPADSRHPNAHDDANTDSRGGGLRETVRHMIVTKRVLNAQRDRGRERVYVFIIMFGFILVDRELLRFVRARVRYL